MRVDFELRNFRRLREKGLSAFRAGRRAEARSRLLLAADCLFRIAGRSEPPFRERRIRDARELLELAKGISADSAAETAGDAPGDAASWMLSSTPDVTFEDVAGLDGVKEEIRLRMVYPFTHPESATRFRIRTGGGLLLYGPPGTGKTLLARAIAGEIDARFFTVRPSDVMSKWVGEAEKNVARLFEEARSHPRSVIFIDEVEALAPARTGDASSVMTRVVPQLLGELEGIRGRGGAALLFVGATNAPWDLDPAILRPGRFDVKVYVGLPDEEAREAILTREILGRPLAEDVDPGRLACLLEGYSGADLRRVAEKAIGESFLEEVRTEVSTRISMEDLLRAAREVRPSVDRQAILRYEEWAAR